MSKDDIACLRKLEKNYIDNSLWQSHMATLSYMRRYDSKIRSKGRRKSRPYPRWIARTWIQRNRAIRAEQEVAALRAENKIQFEEILALQKELSQTPEYEVVQDWKAAVLME